jgi:electron transfer flavoprotein beta subunit
MGPPQATEALRTCVELGVDRALLLTDRLFAGSDTWVTAYILSAALTRLHQEEPLDLVLCGMQAIDGDTAQVGPGIARRLGLTQFTYVDQVREVDLEARTITASRRLEQGFEVVRGPLPALLTCVEELNEVRYASMPNMIRAARYEPAFWTEADLELEEDYLGLTGSPTCVSRIFSPPPAEPAEMCPASPTDPEAGAKWLLEKIYAAEEVVPHEPAL